LAGSQNLHQEFSDCIMPPSPNAITQQELMNTFFKMSTTPDNENNINLIMREYLGIEQNALEEEIALVMKHAVKSRQYG
jgi:hypothetical protein